MSELKKIFTLIPKVMKDVGPISKGGYNDFDKYKFRSIDDVYNKLQPALAANGVFFVPNILDSKENNTVSKSGSEMVRVKLRVRYDIYADDGSKIESIVEGEAIDRSDKATNKALTAAFKYMLIQVFCLAVEGEEDADADSPEVKRNDEIQKSQIPNVTNIGKAPVFNNQNGLVTLRALVNFDEREQAKKAGFQFDKNTKSWVKSVPIDEFKKSPWPFHVEEV